MVKIVRRPVVVVSAFIKKNNKFLIAYDPRFKFWRVPGGRPKYGEKIEDALKREIKEELNIEIKINNFLGFGQDIVTNFFDKKSVTRIILYFNCQSDSKIKRFKEIKKYKWLTLKEIKKHNNLEPAMLDLFNRFKLNKI